MKKKMPESHQSHVYDKRARKNLEEAFPEHWKLNPIADLHSGIEYGDDWLCEVVDEENGKHYVTGARFYIQSKATEKKLGKRARRLGMTFKVSTLNRLNKLTLPVMLHYYHKPSNTGFWMWFGDFYQREYKQSWERKDEIDVYIPTKNVLDEMSVKQLREEVLKFQKLHYLQMQVEAENKIDANYGFHIEAGQGYTRIGMYPKHPNSLEEHPITFNLMVNSDATEKIQLAAEMGIPVQFEANTVFNGLPNWMIENFDEQENMVINLFPHVDEQPSHLQFEYLDSDQNTIFKSKLVEMKLVQPGTKYKRYVGKPQFEPLIFTVVFDAIKPQTSFNVSYDHENRSVEALDWYLDLLENLTRTATARIYNLDTGQSHLLENYDAFEKIGGPNSTVRQFIKDLATISSVLKLNILMPEEPRNLSQNDILLAHGAVEVIQTGISYGLTPIPSELLGGEGKLAISGKNTRSQARRIIAGLETEGEVYIHVPTEATLTVLDYSIELGSAQYYNCCTEILNLDELRQVLADETISEEEQVEMQFALDVTKSYMEYQDWLPNQD